jgi:hypothetical protein
MPNRAAIFAAITKRNELRRLAQLPLLDVRAEMAHAVALAALNEYGAFCDQYKAKLEEFRAEVLAEERATKPDFGHTWGGRLAVAIKSRRRFEAWIAQTFGITKPTFEPKNPIIYGSEKSERRTR